MFYRSIATTMSSVQSSNTCADCITVVSSDGSEQFTLFFGYRCPLSNFHRTGFTLDGLTFINSEQYYHYWKALTFDDNNTAQKILRATHPREQKRLGRSVKNFDQKHWDTVSFDIMKTGTTAKFVQNADACAHLFSKANTTLAEASPWDRKWGIGMARDNPNVNNKLNWKGENLLGRVLEKVTAELVEIVMNE